MLVCLTTASCDSLLFSAISGKGVLQGNEMEYWKKGFFKAEGN